MIKQSKFPLFDVKEPKKLVATIILGLAFLAFCWEIISAFRANEQITIVNRPTKVTSVLERLRADSPLFKTALFGHYVPVNLSDAEIKQSMLDVQVVGILFSGKENDSQVILRTGHGEEKYYLIGDSLPGGAVIKRISERGVVVLHNGSLESLSLSKNELTFDVPAKPLIEE